MDDHPTSATHEWFDGGPEADGTGLRFGCTMCGNCCTGPEGYVLVNDDEIAALATRFGVTRGEFLARYSKSTHLGLSLGEKPSAFGLDCIFLDREKIPGKAVCSVYEDRPRQCRTWPFWKSNLHSARHWSRAAGVCPGVNQGVLVRPEEIRIRRAIVDI